MQKAFPIYAILLLLHAKLPAQVLPGLSYPQEAVLFDPQVLKSQQVRQITEYRRHIQSTDSFELHVLWRFDKKGRLVYKYWQPYGSKPGQGYTDWTYSYLKGNRLQTVQQRSEGAGIRKVWHYRYRKNKRQVDLYAHFYSKQDSSQHLESRLEYDKRGRLRLCIHYQNDSLEDFRQSYTYDHKQRLKQRRTHWPAYRLEWVEDKAVALEDSDQMEEEALQAKDSLEAEPRGRWIYSRVEPQERYEEYHYGAGSSKCLMMDEFPEDQQACRQSYVYDDQQRLVEQHFQNKSKKRQVNRLSYLYDQQGRLLRMFEYYGEKQPVLEYRYRYE